MYLSQNYSKATARNWQSLCVLLNGFCVVLMRGYLCFRPFFSQKGIALLGERGSRSEPRVLPAAGGQNTLSPRKVYFATYTPPQNTDYNLFAPLRRRELCETFNFKHKPGSIASGLMFVYFSGLRGP